MVQDRSEWQGFVRGNAWEDEPPDLDEMTQLWVASYMKPLKGGSPSVAYNLKSIKGKIYVFLLS